MEIRFDPIAHRYHVDGVERPSVTQILAAAGILDTTLYHGHEGARLRGSAVHHACCVIDDGYEDELIVTPEIAPYLEAYRAFLAHVQPEWWSVELAVADPKFGYAGTLDRAGLVFGKRAVVDIKTGDIPTWAGLQTAAYRRCLPGPPTWDRYALQLTEAGLWSLQELTDPMDERVFLCALVVQQWQQTHQWAVAA